MLNDKDKDLKGDSVNYANWQSELSPRTCKTCYDTHGKIEDINIMLKRPSVNEHPYCCCVYVRMRTKIAGATTNAGMNGADAFLIYFKKLPNYYITKIEARKFGWDSIKGNLNEVLPNKMIGGDIFKNYSKKLPVKDNRIWREADINYISGKRNEQRILYSNDGLVFATFDHYETFYEIIPKE